MKIIHLTPGTGNFHCGSCHRDNHLVKALRQRGHDVIMTPLYLPLVTDGEPASGEAPLFVGGINMFLQQKLGLFRKTPRWLDKLFDTPRLLLAAVNRASMTSARDLGEMTLESFRGLSGHQAKEWRRLLDWVCAEQPDLVSLSNGLLSGLAEPIQKEMRVPVICSLQGEDSFLDSLPEPWLTQCWEAFRRASGSVARFAASSEWYAAQMRQRLQLPEEKVAAVRNGLDLSKYVPADHPPTQPTIGYLARMIHGKGIGQLVEAFLLLKKRGRVPGLRLHLGGTMTAADESYLKTLRASLEAAGVSSHVEWHPNLSLTDKIRFLQGLSVFCVPATYGEAFGLYVLEALACGVPVVEPDHAGLGEIVRATGGGLLVQPNDPQALADGLESLLMNSGQAAHLATGGRQAVLTQFSADRMAADFESICLSVA